MATRKNRTEKKEPARPATPIAKTQVKSTLLWLALAVSLFGALLYVNTLGHDYVLDDFSQIKENYVTRQGLDGVPTQWKTHARYGYRPGPGELYRPVPMTMFSLEWEMAPDNPSVGHLINVLLYALTGGVLFLTLARIWRRYHLLFPLLTTLFFLAHPVHVEVVANIKSRDEIVMFLLCVLTLNFLWRFLESSKHVWLAGAYLSYLVALFSKENAVTFLAIFPLCIYFFYEKKWQPAMLWTLPFVGLAAVFVLIRSKVIGAFGSPGDISVLDNMLTGAADAGTRLASAFLLLGKYLMTLLFPHPLCSDLGYNQIPLTDFGDWRALLSIFVWVGMGVFALIGLRSKYLWSFIILFFLINFSISSNLLLTIGTSFGDRLLYAASPAFAMALSYGLLLLFREEMMPKTPDYSWSRLFSNTKIWAVALLVLGLYSFKTTTRNQDWKTSYSLYKKDIETAPNSAKLNFHYGLELVKKGNEANTPAEKKNWYDMAKAHFEKSIAIMPTYHDAFGQLGLAYYREKNYEKALENYQIALKHRPHFPLVYSNMGTLYSETGNNQKARECYETAVKQDPSMVDALRNLGAINAIEGNFTEAIKWFEQGLKYDPDNATLNRYLGSALRDSGRPQDGQPYLQKAERLEKGK